MLLGNQNVPTRSSGLHLASGDEPEYTQAAENMLTAGDYIVDSTNPASRVSRMPGYSLTYLPFRILLGPVAGKAGLVLMQTLLGGVAAYFVALVAFRLTQEPTTFFVALALSVSPTFPAVFDAYTVPDGLASSVAVFSVLNAIAFADCRRRLFAILAGSLAAYLLFLRPFTAPILLFIATFVFIVAEPRTQASTTPSKDWRPRAMALAAFAVPILLTEGAWVTRNWLQLGKVVPLQTGGVQLPGPKRAVWDWMMSHGGDIVPWRPGTVAAWLHGDGTLAIDTVVPQAATTQPSCDAERLAKARLLYQQWLSAASTTPEGDLGARVVGEFDACRVAYVSAHPFDHLVLARGRLLKSFLVHAGPPLPLPPFRSMSTLSAGTALKVLTVTCYGLTMVLSPAGLLLLVGSLNRTPLLIASIPIYFLVLFPFVLGYVETRYVTTAYPFFVIAAAITSSVLLTRRLPTFFRLKGSSPVGTPRGEDPGIG